MIPHRALPPLLAAPLLLGLASASDWPQYNGPSSDRTSAGSIATGWGDDGPTVAWKVDAPGGFSSFAVGGGRAYTLLESGDSERCVALDLETGAELWGRSLGDASYDRGGGAGARGNEGGDGPRSTPSYADGRVFVYDATMVLVALDAESGEVIWRRDVGEEHAARRIKWQNASSPLLVGERVFVAGGGEGESLLAFEAKDGALAWKTGDETMTHATPIVTNLHGVEQVVFFVRSGLVSVLPADGSELWRLEYPFATSTAASPVVHEDVVYVSAGYGVGAGAWRITRDGDGWGSELLWRERNDRMNHWSTPVCVDGHLYGMFGFKEYGRAPLQCVELATGKVVWSQPGFGPGNCILVGQTLVALSDAGELVLAEATPDAYTELARARVLDGKCWSSPAFADGQVYVRSTREGARIDLSR